MGNEQGESLRSRLDAALSGNEGHVEQLLARAMEEEEELLTPERLHRVLHSHPSCQELVLTWQGAPAELIREYVQEHTDSVDCAHTLAAVSITHEYSRVLILELVETRVLYHLGTFLEMLSSGQELHCSDGTAREVLDICASTQGDRREAAAWLLAGWGMERWVLAHLDSSAPMWLLDEWQTPTHALCAWLPGTAKRFVRSHRDSWKGNMAELRQAAKESTQDL